MILDSNIVIYYVDPQYTKLRVFVDRQRPNAHVSAISRVGVLGYHQLDPLDEIKLEDFFDHVFLFAVEEAVLREATKLRQHRKISLGDAIIAATCLLHNEPLLNNNEADFQHVPNLTVIPMRSVI